MDSRLTTTCWRAEHSLNHRLRSRCPPEPEHFWSSTPYRMFKHPSTTRPSLIIVDGHIFSRRFVRAIQSSVLAETVLSTEHDGLPSVNGLFRRLESHLKWDCFRFPWRTELRMECSTAPMSYSSPFKNSSVSTPGMSDCCGSNGTEKAHPSSFGPLPILAPPSRYHETPQPLVCGCVG